MQVTESEVKRIYRQRFSEAENQARNKIWQILVGDFFQKWISPQAVVVDLGCGFGEFLRHVRCARRIGVDLNPDSGEILLPLGIEYLQRSVCDLAPIPDVSVDVVFTSNLMEHLPGKRDVEQMIQEAYRVLRPGGCFVMMGPNIRIIPGAYWDFWDHLVPISELSLVEALENFNFRVADCYARFLPYTTKSSIPKAPWMVRLYLKFPWIWKLMGQQFLIRVFK